MTDQKNKPNQEDEFEVITLAFDDGEEECIIIGVFEAFGEEFIALTPENQEGDVYIYAYKETEDSFDIEDIEDEEKFAKVVAEFEKIVEVTASEEE